MPKYTYICAVLFIFTIPMEKVIDLPGAGSLSRIVGLLTAGLWLLSLIQRRRMRSITAFHVLFFLFVLWNGASYFWSLEGERSLERISTWAQLAILVLIVWDVIRTTPQLRVGMQAYVLGAYLSIGGTIFNYLSEVTFVYGRYSAAGLHVVNLGLLIALGIPFAWYLAFSKNDDFKLISKLRPINIAYLPLAFLGIALTGSRGGMLAALPSLIFILGTLKRLPWKVRILFFLVAGVGMYYAHLLVPESSYQRLSTTYEELTQGGDMSGRVGLWREGLELFTQHPFVGIGTNAYKYTVELGQVAHNSFLSVLVELGIVGLSLFLAMLGYILYNALRLPRTEALFSVTLLLIWFIGASSLTYEHHKPTWLILSFILISARSAIYRPSEDMARGPDRHLIT